MWWSIQNDRGNQRRDLLVLRRGGQTRSTQICSPMLYLMSYTSRVSEPRPGSGISPDIPERQSDRSPLTARSQPKSTGNPVSAQRRIRSSHISAADFTCCGHTTKLYTRTTNENLDWFCRCFYSRDLTHTKQPYLTFRLSGPLISKSISCATVKMSLSPRPHMFVQMM